MGAYNPLFGPAPIAPGENPNDRRNPTMAMDENYSMAVAVDGTPIRVMVLTLSAAVSLTLLRWAGFRFNVGVST